MGAFLHSERTAPNGQLAFLLKTTHQIKMDSWLSSEVVNWMVGWQRR